MRIKKLPIYAKEIFTAVLSQTAHQPCVRCQLFDLMQLLKRDEPQLIGKHAILPPLHGELFPKLSLPSSDLD